MILRNARSNGKATSPIPQHIAVAIPRCKIVPILALSMALSGCNSTTQLQSGGLNRVVTIDGSDDDWRGLLSRLVDTDLTVGFTNDGQDLYVAIVARDQRTVRQIMMSGLIVWLNADGKKDKTLGFRYPVGLAESGFVPHTGARSEEPAAFQDAFRASLGEAEIFEDNEEARFIDLISIPEIAARLTLEVGTIVYELRVPLRREEDRVGVGAIAGTTIAVGFETPEPDRSTMRARFGGRGGGRGAGDFGGMGGGGIGEDDLRGGGRMGGPPGARMRETERLDKWVTLALAK